MELRQMLKGREVDPTRQTLTRFRVAYPYMFIGVRDGRKLPVRVSARNADFKHDEMKGSPWGKPPSLWLRFLIDEIHKSSPLEKILGPLRVHVLEKTLYVVRWGSPYTPPWAAPVNS